MHGLNPGFYHENFQKCCYWLETKTFHTRLDLTHIVLIPKGDQFAFIANKLKIHVANKLKIHVAKCISENQFAFVSGQTIFYNFMAVIELVHYTKTKTPGKVCDVALKLDISKTFDRSDWNYLWDYLWDVTLTLGFSHKWITLIMFYVESVDYSDC